MSLCLSKGGRCEGGMETERKRRLILRVSGLADLSQPSRVASAEVVFNHRPRYGCTRKILIDFPFSFSLSSPSMSFSLPSVTKVSSQQGKGRKNERRMLICETFTFGRYNLVCAYFFFLSVGEGGVIKGWEERTLNMSKAVRYNKELGTFTVEKAGVYFLFCQVSLWWEL